MNLVAIVKVYHLTLEVALEFRKVANYSCQWEEEMMFVKVLSPLVGKQTSQ